MKSKGRGGKPTQCHVAVDTSDPALPVAGTGKLSKVRKSKNSRKRVIVLLAVHVLIAAHITHYLVTKRTVSPVEPSETMYTLELGELNAGFIFLLVALLGTLIFGRYVCGWGCHLVALQDSCAWLMKKLGIRPRPFRSRLLLLAPALVALYMFVWPTVQRVFFGGGPFPGFSNHLMTDSFWKTFPGPLFATLTFASCGFAAVYFLGAKGFCTYGCPYGALFGAVDRLSPGRIVVNDSCEGCGHCTVTCTSNVLVHEEVRLYGQVVDPGCMKCMDCVSVCPKNALRFAFARPSLFKGRPAGKRRARRYTLGLGEELFLASTGLAATLTFRGLYDGPPLLMSVALGGITAFLLLKLWQVWRRPTVRVQNLALKLAGQVQRSGWLFAALTVLWLSFTGHSAFTQWHRAWGTYHLNRTEAGRSEVLTGAFAGPELSRDHDRAAARAFRHFSLTDRWGLVDVVEVKLGLGWSHLLRHDVQLAEAQVRAAIALAPDRPLLHENLIELLASRGRFPEAIAALEAKLQAIEPTAEDHFRLGGMLAQAGRHQQAADQYLACLVLGPDSAAARFNLGGVYRRLERHDEAIEQLRAAERLVPDDADTQVELGLAYMAVGDDQRALQAFQRAIELNPDSPESRFHLPGLIEQLEGSSVR